MGGLLVVAALELEIRGLLRRLPPSLQRTLTLRTVGPRAAHLDRLDLLPGPRPSAVLVTGLAGGCEPGLAPGDVILGDPVAAIAPRRQEVEPDPELRRRAVRALEAAGVRYRAGRLLTVDEVVTSSAAKARWWQTGNVAAVDMESARVLDWARRAGLPGVAVRAVADGPEDELPSDLLGVVGTDGRLRARTVARLLGHPSLLAPAWRMGRRSGRGLESLGRFMRVFADTPGEP